MNAIVVDMEMRMDMDMDMEGGRGRGNTSIRMVGTPPRIRCRRSDIVCHLVRLVRLVRGMVAHMTMKRARAMWRIMRRCGESTVVFVFLSLPVLVLLPMLVLLPALGHIRIAPAQAKTRKKREGVGLETESSRF